MHRILLNSILRVNIKNELKIQIIINLIYIQNSTTIKVQGVLFKGGVYRASTKKAFLSDLAIFSPSPEQSSAQDKRRSLSNFGFPMSVGMARTV